MPKAPGDNNWMTATDAAALLTVSRKTFLKIAKAHGVRVRDFGGVVTPTYLRADVEQLAQRYAPPAMSA